jgi:hypothetical protein
MEYSSPYFNQSSYNYANFRGFEYMRPAYNNHSLNRTFYTYLPLSRMAHVSGQGRRRSMSPPSVERVIELDEVEEPPVPNSARQVFAADELLMGDVPSVSTSDCPMADIPAVGGSAYQGEAFGEPHMAANPPPNEPPHDTISQINRHTRMEIPNMLNPETPSNYGQDSQQGTSHNPLLISTPSVSSMLSTRYGSPTISSTTIRGDSSWVTERRNTLVTDIHSACLEASNRYIRLLRHSAHNHHHGMRQGRNARYHPYSPPSYRARSPFSRRDQNTTARTLMENISRISTHLWREARRDIMARHRAEADTVRRMRNLYAWGEVVVRSVADGWDYENEDDGRSTMTGVPEDGIGRICEAARRFCLGLRDQGAWDECDRHARALGNLRSQERGRGRSVSFGESSDGIR